MIDLDLVVNGEGESLIDIEKAELKHFFLTQFRSSKFKYTYQMKENIVFSPSVIKEKQN